MKKLCLFLMSLMMFGCTGITQYRHQISENDGTIHLYRVEELNAAGMNAIFYVDDQSILKLGTSHYAEVPISPGKHTISVKADSTTQKMTYELIVEPNQQYYFMVKANPDRLGPQMLIPFIEIVSIPGFLLIKRDEATYLQESTHFQPETIVLTNMNSLAVQ
ncbi:DUF2846 domain-containing protein [Photobacterium sp. CCB-ST2H9]|uniref:DUF2846 domain-containing protein n=1 Tax=Photobacterium sp. CCB-ST2H9 TaxID=2912855 RepID=UPI0020065FE8|nr:DUF2846 domain-containing protein [Photobacterium sp. CCB-ST2H9]UTM59092.1 DUF2846 domain-containing protein [Photobacterium sp. CCB-ST2H9]